MKVLVVDDDPGLRQSLTLLLSSEGYDVTSEGGPLRGGFAHPAASVSPAAVLEGSFYVGPGCEVEPGARLGPDTVLVADVRVRGGARLRNCVLWRGVEAGPDCDVEASVLGPGVRLGRASVLRGAVLGEGSAVSDYSRTL